MAVRTLPSRFPGASWEYFSSNITLMFFPPESDLFYYLSKINFYDVIFSFCIPIKILLFFFIFYLFLNCQYFVRKLRF